MKYALTQAIFFTLLLFAACKKDNDTNKAIGPSGSSGITGTTGSTGSTGATGSTGNTGGQHSGLELMVDTGATQYCVIINSTDTMVWENTKGDAVSAGGGVLFGTTPLDYTSYTSITSTRGGFWTKFTVLFKQPEYNGSGTPPCSAIDSLITTGQKTLATTGLGMSITDTNGVLCSTWNGSPAYAFNVISITPISQGNGCHALRVKATFSNTIFGLYDCIVPHPDVKQGEFQLDFKI